LTWLSSHITTDTCQAFNWPQQSDFPGCRPTDMERSASRRDFSRVVIHLPSAAQNSPVHEILFSDYFFGLDFN